MPTVAASSISRFCSNVAILEYIYHTTQQKMELGTMQPTHDTAIGSSQRIMTGPTRMGYTTLQSSMWEMPWTTLADFDN